jgi:hypothetical protein
MPTDAESIDIYAGTIWNPPGAERDPLIRFEMFALRRKELVFGAAQARTVC